jgi:hypothetical protein
MQPRTYMYLHVRCNLSYHKNTKRSSTEHPEVLCFAVKLFVHVQADRMNAPGKPKAYTSGQWLESGAHRACSSLSFHHLTGNSGAGCRIHERYREVPAVWNAYFCAVA